MSELIEGYASLFGRVDLARDAVERGAFRGALARRGAGNIRMLWQHDPAQPIGVWLSITEDERGLYCRGRLVPEAAKSAEVGALLDAGALDGLSIGYRTVRAHTDPATRVRRLVEVDLWEISIVTFPLLPEARLRAKGWRAKDWRADAGLSTSPRRKSGSPDLRVLNTEPWSSPGSGGERSRA